MRLNHKWARQLMSRVNRAARALGALAALALALGAGSKWN